MLYEHELHKEYRKICIKTKQEGPEFINNLKKLILKARGVNDDLRLIFKLYLLYHLEEDNSVKILAERIINKDHKDLLNETIMTAYNCLGIIYHSHYNDIAQSNEYYDKCLQLTKCVNSNFAKIVEISVTTNMAISLNILKKRTKAQELMFDIIAKYSNEKDVYICHQIDKCYALLINLLRKKNNKDARYYCRKRIRKLRNKTKNFFIINYIEALNQYANTVTTRSSSFSRNIKFKYAISIYDKAIKLCENSKQYNLKLAYVRTLNAKGSLLLEYNKPFEGKKCFENVMNRLSNPNESLLKYEYYDSYNKYMISLYKINDHKSTLELEKAYKNIKSKFDFSDQNIKNMIYQIILTYASNNCQGTELLNHFKNSIEANPEDVVGLNMPFIDYWIFETISSAERKKNYDIVINALSTFLKCIPFIKKYYIYSKNKKNDYDYSTSINRLKNTLKNTIQHIAKDRSKKQKLWSLFEKELINNNVKTNDDSLNKHNLLFIDELFAWPINFYSNYKKISNIDQKNSVFLRKTCLKLFELIFKSQELCKTIVNEDKERRRSNNQNKKSTKAKVGQELFCNNNEIEPQIYYHYTDINALRSILAENEFTENKTAQENNSSVLRFCSLTNVNDPDEGLSTNQILQKS